MRLVVLWIVCMTACCGRQEPAPVAAPDASPREDTGRARGDDLEHSVFTQRVTEPELIRFLTVLPAFAEGLERARHEDTHPERWRVQPLASPDTNPYLWQRLGPMVTHRFGADFGRTWLKVWVAFSAVQSQRRIHDLIASWRARLDDPTVPAEKKQAIRRQLEQIHDSSPSDMEPARVPPENIALVRRHADELEELSHRLFEPSKGR